MDEERTQIEYASRLEASRHFDRWMTAIEIAALLCIVMTLAVGLMTVIIQSESTAQTPEFRAFVAATAATQPGVKIVDVSQFKGQAYAWVPFYKVYLFPYFMASIAAVAALIALRIYLAIERRRR